MTLGSQVVDLCWLDLADNLHQTGRVCHVSVVQVHSCNTITAQHCPHMVWISYKVCVKVSWCAGNFLFKLEQQIFLHRQRHRDTRPTMHVRTHTYHRLLPGHTNTHTNDNNFNKTEKQKERKVADFSVKIRMTGECNKCILYA